MMKTMLNPPSIPSHDFVFGYDVKEGAFVKQNNPEKVYKGEKEDFIGPGHYNANANLTQPQKRTTDFGKSSSA